MTSPVVPSASRHALWIAAALALTTTGNARADGISCDAKLRATSENTAADGAALEKSGKLVEAYLHYRAATEYCDVASAKDGQRRVGKALGAAAEKAGRGYGEDRFRGWWGSKGGCLGKATPECVDPAELETMRRASAVAWYEVSGHPSETDRLVLAHAKANAGDLAVFRKAWSHFREREHAGAADAPKPGTPRAELQQLASARAQKALATEAQEFAKGLDETGVRGSQCLAQLGEAQTWMDAAQIDSAPVRARAVERGDARLRGATLLELGEAKRFYEFAERADKQQQAKAKAGAEGEKALAAGQRLKAVQYFTLAEDDARAKAAAPQVDPASLPKPDAEKLKKLQKTDSEKEQFRKEQESLEKELGM